eukprot:TRINITY_DN1679_c0_g1_i7.p1 TRINITY_DN1679_c0_g1~~TRINITY_DN1679_c0_g1_i7.p1  ORF type:complete len:113 (+),score=2.23 TRINITY_DN1679_c0_g1_i7:218-556(+)
MRGRTESFFLSFLLSPPPPPSVFLVHSLCSMGLKNGRREEGGKERKQDGKLTNVKCCVVIIPSPLFFNSVCILSCSPFSFYGAARPLAGFRRYACLPKDEGGDRILFLFPTM